MTQPSGAPTQCPKCSSLEIEMPVEIWALFNNGEIASLGGIEDYLEIKGTALMCRCPDCQHEWPVTL